MPANVRLSTGFEYVFSNVFIETGKPLIKSDKYKTADTENGYGQSASALQLKRINFTPSEEIFKFGV